MKIGLHDAERDHLRNKSFPNLAIMKISAWHKFQGDEVEWWNPLCNYDRVYSSKVFDFTPVDQYLMNVESVIRGGTGYTDLPVDNRLPKEIDDMFPDYSIYPECDYAIGYLTRGCPNNCRWCVVPKKEGQITPYRNWQDIVRKDTEKLVLMDNNILACEYGIGQFESLIGSGVEEGKYVLLALKDVEKDKELRYMMEQDSYFGVYIDDREGVDADWDSGNYEPDGCCYLEPKNVEILGGGE